MNNFPITYKLTPRTMKEFEQQEQYKTEEIMGKIGLAICLIASVVAVVFILMTGA